jgi:hypothetical protein
MLSRGAPAAFFRYFPRGPAASRAARGKEKRMGKREAHLLIGRWHASKRTDAKLVWTNLL